MNLPKSQTVSAFDAKTHLSNLLKRVEKGERITITRHNVPIAVLIPAEQSLHSPEVIIEKILLTRKNTKIEGICLSVLQDEGRA